MNPAEATVVCSTPWGRLRGRNSDGVTHYLRVPYAQSPTGPRRFALPEAVQAWSGIRDAIQPGPIPPQLPSRLSRVMSDPPVAQDEDCLHLDIWVPETATPELSAPVLAFIHGGAFMTGGGSLPMYQGAALARRTGMVVVNISYRLGILGFLPIPGLAPANLGLHDQLAALRWIQRGIASFGGNPDCVTLVGQSAGAYSIALLLATTQAQGLFHRAMPMSAPLGLKLPPPEQTREVAADLLRRLNISPDQFEDLRHVPIDRLLEVQGSLARDWASRSADVSPPFVPVPDNHLIPAPPLERLLANAGWSCPTLWGYTREEMAVFYCGNTELEAQAGQIVAQLLESDADGAPNNLGLARARSSRAPNDDLSILGDLITESLFAQPTRQIAEHLQGTGSTAYLYRWDWQSPEPGLGACHCIDLPFLFGNFSDWQDSPMVNAALSAEFAALAEAFQDRLAAFAHTGIPSNDSLTPWPEYGAAGLPLLCTFDRKIGLAYVPVND